MLSREFIGIPLGRRTVSALVKLRRSSGVLVVIRGNRLPALLIDDVSFTQVNENVYPSLIEQSDAHSRRKNLKRE